MNFSNEQKLIITLLTDIHAHLDIQGSVDPTFVQKVVELDQCWALEWKYPGLFSEEETPASVQFVADTLDLWETLEISYNRLEAGEKDELSRLAEPFGDNVVFPGFDGHTQYLGIAKILINDLDRWEHFKGHKLDAHAPTTDGYRRMIECYKQLPREVRFDRDLNVEEIAQLLKERVHPSCR